MANTAYQDQITFVNTPMVGISDRLSNPSQYHPMVRNDWGTTDKLRGLLGKYYAPIYPTNPNLPSVVLLNYADLYGNPLEFLLVQDKNQDTLLVGQAAGTNQGTNLIFDYTVSTPSAETLDGSITLTYSPAGWASPGYNLSYQPATSYFGQVNDDREAWWGTVAGRISRYMGGTACPYWRRPSHCKER